MSAEPNVVTAARRYIESGWNIVAVAGKRPIEDDWRNRPMTIENYQAQLGQPNVTGIGFLGGAINKNVVPIDFDTSKAYLWFVDECLKVGIEAKSFPTHRSKKGRHVFVHDVRGTLGNTRGALPAGIDIRGNGQVLLPPSRHVDGGYYTAENSLLRYVGSPPACPDFIYDLIEKPKHTSTGNGASHKPASNAENSYCRRALDYERANLAKLTKGRRNEELNNAALKLGSLAHYGAFGEDEVRAALRNACEVNGYIANDGLPAFEATFDSGWKAGLAQPREIPAGEPPPRDRQRQAPPPPPGDGQQGQAEPGDDPAAGRRFVLVPFNRIKARRDCYYLVRNVIPREGLIVMWGPPKCGKSFICLDLTMHIALGWEYRGHKVKGGPVVYITCEGERGIGARVDAFKQKHLDSYEATIPFHLVVTRLDFIGEHGQLVVDISAQIGETRPSVVVIDTLNRSLVGSESSDEDMGAYVKAADAVREAFGCAVIVIHHCGIDGSRPRGHTSLTGAADADIAVLKDEAGIVTSTVRYMKDGEEGTVISSRLEQIEVGTDDEGDPITSCIVTQADPSPNKPAKGSGLSANQQTLLTILVDAGQGGLSLDEWNARARDAGIGTNRKATLFDIRAALKAKRLVYEFSSRWFVRR